MKNIDLTKLSLKEIQELQKQLSDIKKTQKPFSIEETDTDIILKVSKSHFINEAKTNQKNGTPYTLLSSIGGYGMEKVKVNNKSYGIKFTLLEY